VRVMWICVPGPLCTYGHDDTTAGGASKQRWYDARLTRLGMGIGNPPIYRTFFLSPLDAVSFAVSVSHSPSFLPSLSLSLSLSFSLSSLAPFRSRYCAQTGSSIYERF